MKLARVSVRISELHTQHVTIGAHEVGVLQAVHGPEQVQVLGHQEDNRPPPDARDEYARLEQRYGADREQGGIPFVAAVYGQHEPGIASLARTIADCNPGGNKVASAASEGATTSFPAGAARGGTRGDETGSSGPPGGSIGHAPGGSNGGAPHDPFEPSAAPDQAPPPEDAGGDVAAEPLPGRPVGE